MNKRKLRKMKKELNKLKKESQEIFIKNRISNELDYYYTLNNIKKKRLEDISKKLWICSFCLKENFEERSICVYCNTPKEYIKQNDLDNFIRTYW